MRKAKALSAAVRIHNMFPEAKLTFLWWKHLPGKAHDLNKLCCTRKTNSPHSRELDRQGEATNETTSFHLPSANR